MLLSIRKPSGQKGSGEGRVDGAPSAEVTDAFLDCHGRIRHFVVILERLVAGAAASSAEVADAADACRRYFVEALPLHVADEDDSLVPRLRGIEPTLDAALDRMRDEHRDHDAMIAEVVRLCERLVADPEHAHRLDADETARVAELRRALEAHLLHEETTVFVAAREHLSADAKARIADEMRERRKHLDGAAIELSRQ